MNFQTIASNLLFIENDYGKLYETVNKYYRFLLKLSDLPENSFEKQDIQETWLDSGKAISPLDAGRCVLGIDRTTKFLRGIYYAILEAKNKYAFEKIEILYAGCGPFAALLVPLCTKFRADEVTFHLIDIHQYSLDSAHKVFKKLGFEDYVSAYIKTDAAKYKDKNGKKFHIIITETMQHALQSEPQVSITMNLAPQLKDGEFFIPEKISVEAYLINIGKEVSFFENSEIVKERIFIGEIFELSLKSIDSSEFLTPSKFSLPFVKSDKLNLALLTNITVFDKQKLSGYDSALTQPKILFDYTGIKSKKHIQFQYVLDKNPRFEYLLL